MKQTIALLVILLIGVVSATSYDVYSGDSIFFDLGQEYEYYSIVENSSVVNINVSQNNTLVKISFSKYSVPDNFSIIFFDSEDQVIKKYRGGSYTKSKVNEFEGPISTQYPEEPTDPINITDDEPDEEKEFDKRWYGVFLMLFGTSCGLSYWLYSIMKKKKQKN